LSCLLNSVVANLDKTQVFHDQIEVKQKELQPWTAKINAKKAEIDVATSEQDALSRKAEAIREAGKAAAEELKQIQRDREAKVRLQCCELCCLVHRFGAR
jgi:structural maintenance of chromosome 4